MSRSGKSSRQARESSPKDPFASVEQGYSDLNLYNRPGAFQLGYWMLTAEAARISAFVRRLRSLGLSKATGQYVTLRDLYFAKDHCMTQRAIVQGRGVSSPNVTRWIHGLERDGLVARSIDPEDRRTTLVKLTPAGERLCQWLVPEIAQFVTEVSNCLTDDEIATLTGLLERLQKHADSMTHDRSD